MKDLLTKSVFLITFFSEMAAPERFELPLFWVRTRRLTNSTKGHGASRGIRTHILRIKSPPFSPLNYWCILVPQKRFELSTYRLKVCYSTNWVTGAYGGTDRNWTGATWIFSPVLYLLSYSSIYGAPYEARTHDPQIKSLVLFQLS